MKCRIIQNLEVKFVKILREENIDSKQMAKAASSMRHKHRRLPFFGGQHLFSSEGNRPCPRGMGWRMKMVLPPILVLTTIYIVPFME